MENDVNRSTRSGQFVKESTAERDPRHTTTEHVDGSAGDREVHRSASTGRFVTETTSELHEPLPRISTSDGSQEVESRAVGRIAVTGLWPCCGRSR
jgi:hypothetical protein